MHCVCHINDSPWSAAADVIGLFGQGEGPVAEAADWEERCMTSPAEPGGSHEGRRNPEHYLSFDWLKEGGVENGEMVYQ